MIRIHLLRRVALLAVFLGQGLAQDIAGTLTGRVTDSTGAAVPGVKLDLLNERTNVTMTQVANEQGIYIFNLVPPSRFTLRATLQGFQTAVRREIAVEVNRTTRVDVSLAVGTVAETMEVTASSTRLDTTSAQISTTASAKVITELPSSSRNVLKFAELAPGVSIRNEASQVMNIEGTYAGVNGNRQGRNVFYLDGSDNTASFRNSALQFPNPEAVQELNVTTSNTSAEFGKQPGGVFNVITKSGTNEFHGAGFYFFTDSALNANTWARNRSGSPRGAAELKQMGGTLGGPIKRDKLFFFGSYMHYRNEEAGFQNTVRFPTQALTQGDFSQFNQAINDPTTQQPFPGNRIPANMLEPVSRNLLQLIPTVANFDDRYVWSFVNPVRNNEFLAKTDYNLNSNHALMVSYFRTFGDQKLANTAATSNIPAFGPQINVSDQHTGSARHTWTMSPRLLLQSRFAVAYHIADRTNANIGKNLADFGAAWPDSQAGARKYLPRLNIAQGPQAHTGFLSLFDQHNYRFGSTLSWVRGKHNFRFGGEAQRDTVAQFNDTDSTVLGFDGRASSLGRGQNIFGFAMADFMLGRLSTFSTTGILDYNLSNWAYFFFVQDEWRVTPRLTLTPGLRYELYSPAAEANGRTSTFLLGHRSNQFANAPANLAFQGDAGIRDGFTKRDNNNFAPRLGVAYDLTGDGKTVLRGGAGIYFAYNPMQIRMWNAEANPWRPAASGGEALLRDPWRTSRTIVYNAPPTPFDPDPAKFVYPSRLTNVVGFDNGFATPYSMQWNVSAARDIGGKVTVEVGYVGNRGLKLLQMIPGNYPAYTPQATLGNLEARRPIAGYGHVSIIHSRAKSYYDALQFTADTRLARGLTSRVTYVYSGEFNLWNNDPLGNGDQQTANIYNLDMEKGPDGSRQTFRAFFVYDVPLFAKSSSMLAKVAGGWQMSGSFFARSGEAANLTLGEDRNLDGNGSDRPNVTGPVRYTSGSADTRANAWIADTSIFVPQPVGEFGGLSRNALRGPGAWDADFSVLKNFKVAERRTLQLRTEAYNVFNHPNLGFPNLNMRNSDYNKIIVRNGNRTMQVGLRFLF